MIALAACGGQEDAERRSCFAHGGAFHFHPAMELFHNSLDDPQANARALLALGAEERLEDDVQVVERDSTAGIAYPHDDLMLGGTLDAERQSSLLSDRVDCVGD